MERLPQRLVNVRVADRDAAMASGELAEAVERESAALEGRGRVLVRPSGTEQLVRVMVEAPTEDEADDSLRAPRRGRAARIAADRPGSGRISPSMRRGVVARVEARPVGPQMAPALVHGGSRHPCAASSATSDERPAQRSAARRASRSWSTAATTRPASRSSRGDALESVRAVGNLANLHAAVAAAGARRRRRRAVAAARPATTGIGHTRWATHGRVTERNAHPHSDTADRVHVVVNGIVENYLTLKRPPRSTRAPSSPRETDAEVIAHLVAHHMALGTLDEAVRAAYAELEGHYAFVAMSLDDPDVARRRAQGVPAGRRPRRRRAVPRLRDPGLPRARRAASSSSRTARSSSCAPRASRS